MASSMRFPHLVVVAVVLVLAMVSIEMKKVDSIEDELAPMPAMAAGLAFPSSVAFGFNFVVPLLLCVFGV
uniref:Transmembrane protein n=1 Tax=Cucumis melo TaxID=3656 RepID=A0A9I9DTN6_CUCME